MKRKGNGPLSIQTIRNGYLYLVIPVLLCNAVVFENTLRINLVLDVVDIFIVRIVLWFSGLWMIAIAWGLTKKSRTFWTKMSDLVTYKLKLIMQIMAGVYGLLVYILGGHPLDVVLLSAISFFSIVFFQMRQERIFTAIRLD